LKRQRGEGDANGGDSHTSEGEAAPTFEIENGRNAKWSRIVDEGDNGCDPLDTLNQTPGSEFRSHVVRFGTHPIVPMAPLITIAGHDEQPTLPPGSPSSQNEVHDVHAIVE